MSVQNFLKTHWYTITMASIFCISILILYLSKFNNTKAPILCTKLNKIGYITDIIIGQNPTKDPNNNYCPDGYSNIQSDLNSLNDDFATPNNIPYIQLCAKQPANVCEADSVVTDIKFSPMGNSANDGWVDVDKRCVDPYFPADLIDPTNYSKSDDLGKLRTPYNPLTRPVYNTSPPCSKMGLCIKMGKTTEPLLYNNIKLVYGTLINPPVCPTGFTTDNINLHDGCDSFDGSGVIYLCKKKSNQ